MTTSSQPDRGLNPDDRRIIETIGIHFSPQEMGPSHRAAFRQRLGERLERRNRLPVGLALATASVVLLALVLWPWNRSTLVAAPQTDAQASLDAGVEYAYVDPDLYDGSLRSSSSWPEDFRVLAVAADIPINGSVYSE